MGSDLAERIQRKALEIWSCRDGSQSDPRKERTSSTASYDAGTYGAGRPGFITIATTACGDRRPVDKADPKSLASASSDKMTTDSKRRPESHEDRKREQTEREEEAPGSKEARALGSAMEIEGEDAPTESVPEPKGEKRLQAPPFYAGSESPSRRV